MNKHGQAIPISPATVIYSFAYRIHDVYGNDPSADKCQLIGIQ